MNKKKLKVATTVRTTQELAEVLGLSASERIEIQFSVELNNKIIEIVENNGLTHAEVSKLAGI